MVNINKISREITTYWFIMIFYLNWFFLDLVHQQYLKNLQVFVVEAIIHLLFFSKKDQVFDALPDECEV